VHGHSKGKKAAKALEPTSLLARSGGSEGELTFKTVELSASPGPNGLDGGLVSEPCAQRVHEVGTNRASGRADKGHVDAIRGTRHGRLDRGALTSARGTGAVAMMRVVRTALDPLGILNPGKVLPDA
jgi:FAD linked oxidases, C-terminal domain